MASKGKKKSQGKSGSGSMMNMRSGFRKAAGQDKRGRRKKDVSFLTVLAWMFGAAFLMFFIWSFTR